MNRIRRRLWTSPAESGFTLIETMVALMVFAIAAAGLVAGAVAITRVTGDSRARQVAVRLAARDLDQARTAANPLSVPARTYTVTSSDPDGDPTHTFKVARTVSSVTASGADTTCGSNVNFGYRRVSVVVSWPGQLATTAPVRSDTILAPGTPAVDAGTGAISIRVTGADGLPRSGIDVSVAPVTGGTGEALSSQPSDTGVDGCSYADRVTPGAYTVTLSKSDFIDTAQQAPTVVTTSVAAGSTAGIQATLDQDGNFVTYYAKNYPGPGTPSLPSNLQTSFVPTTLPALNVATKSAVAGGTQPLYPGGYDAVAGKFADAGRNTVCASMDPAAWPAGTVSGTRLAQGVRASASAASGQTATFATPQTTSIPMGVVKVTALVGTYITARAATPAGLGNPGCATPSADLTFGQVPAGGTMYIALPFGTWNIYQGVSVGTIGVFLPSASVQAPTNFTAGYGVSSTVVGGLTGNSVTLDPRTVAP